MILINQRLESKTTVSVLAHFLGTAHNTRAEIHRLSREGTKSLCTNSGFAAPPPVAPQARWVFGPSSGEYHFPAAADLHPSTLISLRCKRWEGTEREFQKCRSCSRTGWALMAEQQLCRAVLVPGELEAAGSSCTGTKDNCTRTQSSSSRETTAPLTAHLRLLWFWNSISRLGTPTRILKPARAAEATTVRGLEHTKAVKWLQAAWDKGGWGTIGIFPCLKWDTEKLELNTFL